MSYKAVGLLSSPNQAISVFDEKYISNQNTKYFLAGTDILDENGFKVYSFTKELNQVVLSDTGRTVLFNMKYNQQKFPIDKITIYSGKTDSTVVATLSVSFSITSRKYFINYVDKETKKTFSLEMKSDLNFRFNDIYAGKKKEKAPKIGIITNRNGDYDYSIEVAANVDQLFMIAIGICVYKLHLNSTHSIA